MCHSVPRNNFVYPHFSHAHLSSFPPSLCLNAGGCFYAPRRRRRRRRWHFGNFKWFSWATGLASLIHQASKLRSRFLFAFRILPPYVGSRMRGIPNWKIERKVMIGDRLEFHQCWIYFWTLPTITHALFPLLSQHSTFTISILHFGKLANFCFTKLEKMIDPSARVD